MTDINWIREQLTNIIKTIADTQEQYEYRQQLAELRNIDKSVLDKAEIIYIPDRTYMYKFIQDEGLLDKLGFTDEGDNIFRDRYVIPIKSQTGKVIGLCGYRSNDDIKYLFSNTTLYFDKTNHFYNEQYMKLIYKMDWVIVTEGFFDSLRLNSMGLYNNLALMGTLLYPQQKTILNRIKYKIAILDNDNSGKKAEGLLKQNLNKLAIIKIQDRNTKDIDEYIKKIGDIQKIKQTIRQALDRLSNPLITNTELAL